MLATLALLAALTPSPTPSPARSPLPVIATVRVATGSPQTLHQLPVLASALDRTDLGAASAYASDALLRQLPGFDRTRSNSLFTNYGQLRVSFAGAGNDRGLVLADGIPAQDGFGGQIDWAAYPANDIQRAELLLGAGSALYGSGAIGGVLDLQTFAPASTPQGTLSLAAGTNAYSQQWLDFRSPVMPRLSTSIVLQQQRLQYAASPPAYQSAVDRQAQSTASMAALRLRYAAGVRDTIELGERQAWDDQFEGRPNYTFSRRLAQTDLRYTHATLQSTLAATVYERNTFILNVADQFPLHPGSLRYVQDVPTNESGAGVRWITGGGPSTFEIVAEGKHAGGQVTQYGPSGSVQNAASGVQNAAGFAAQETWTGARAEAVAGARFDSIHEPDGRTDQAVSPRLAARYDLSPHVAVRASFGSGLRAPFLNELLRGYFIGNVQFEPNALLVPERSHTTSAGIDLLQTHSHISFDAFETGVNDAIMFRTIDPAHQVRSNVARTQTNAYVLSFTRTLGTCSRISAWLTAQNARVTAGPAAIIGKQLQYVPKASASVEYASHIGAVSTGLSVSYLGETYADDLNRQPLGTAVVAGARAGIPLAGGASLDIRADNLTGARYLSSVDRYGPPATIVMSVHAPLGQSSPPGACSQ